VKVPEVVPSRPLATVERWTMASLDPVMSSIDMLDHAVEPVVSPAQPTLHVEPSLKESPGAGSLGVTVAWDSRTALEARRVVKTMDVNMTF